MNFGLSVVSVFLCKRRKFRINMRRSGITSPRPSYRPCPPREKNPCVVVDVIDPYTPRRIRERLKRKHSVSHTEHAIYVATPHPPSRVGGSYTARPKPRVVAAVTPLQLVRHRRATKNFIRSVDISVAREPSMGQHSRKGLHPALQSRDLECNNDKKIIELQQRINEMQKELALMYHECLDFDNRFLFQDRFERHHDELDTKDVQNACSASNDVDFDNEMPLTNSAPNLDPCLMCQLPTISADDVNVRTDFWGPIPEAIHAKSTAVETASPKDEHSRTGDEEPRIVVAIRCLGECDSFQTHCQSQTHRGGAVQVLHGLSCSLVVGGGSAPTEFRLLDVTSRWSAHSEAKGDPDESEPERTIAMLLLEDPVNGSTMCVSANEESNTITLSRLDWNAADGCPAAATIPLAAENLWEIVLPPDEDWNPCESIISSDDTQIEARETNRWCVSAWIRPLSKINYWLSCGIPAMRTSCATVSMALVGDECPRCRYFITTTTFA